MNTLRAAILVWLLTSAVALRADSSASCGQVLQVPLPSHSELRIDSRPAGLDVVGTSEPMMRVTCSEDSSGAEPITLRLTGSSGEQTLTISGSAMHGDNLKIRVEVPRRTNLAIHMPAGQVTVKGVAGDKDIELSAGQITMEIGDPGEYASVHADVDIGEVKASAYGVDKGGFFRSFSRQTAGGDYRIRAHVLTGEIDLQ